MRKVIGIGETVLDIIFKDGRPVSAVPGGSVYNGIISLGRAGVPAAFVSEVGNDRIGERTVGFLRENGVDASFVSTNKGSKSPISLAFSYYAVNPVIRPQVAAILNAARDRGAIIYYDVNFRAAHADEVMKLTPNILENFEYADIVRGSREDFNVMYGMDTPDKVYNSQVSFYCKKFVYTDGAAAVELRGDGGLKKSYPVAAAETVSTIGAGDNFNAGLVYGLVKYGVTRDMIGGALPEPVWDDIIGCAMAFSANCCKSLGNSVDEAFGQAMKAGL